MQFVVNNKKLLEKYESIWNKIGNVQEENLKNSQFTVEKNAKLKSYNGKINKDYLGKNPPQKRLLFYLFGRNSTRLIIQKKNKDNEYYPQIYLEECEYGEKKAKKAVTSKKKQQFLIATKVIKIMMSLSNKSSSFPRTIE